MASVIGILIAVAVILAGVSLVAQASFKGMDMLSDAWKQMEVRSGEIARTEIEVVDADEQPPLIDIRIRNSGKTPVRDWETWDVIVQYYDDSANYYQRWLPYTSSPSPGNNQWTVTAIYTELGGAEEFQPNILDPEEEMNIRIRLSPASRRQRDNKAVIGTPNGVTVSTLY